MPVDTTRAATAASPLWVISLFIALCEIIAGIAVIRAEGATRAAFAAFAVVFPFVVLATFVWLLVQHSDKLYSPNQYVGTGLTPAAFAEARAKAFAVGQQSAEDRTEVYAEAVSQAVAESVADTDGAVANTEALGEQIVENVRRLVEERSVRVELGVLDPERPPLDIPVTSKTTVQTLLDRVYFAIADYVEPYHYNESWVLARSDGSRLTSIGTSWAAEHGLGDDRRTLSKAGINAGDTLTVIPLIQKSSALADTLPA